MKVFSLLICCYNPEKTITILGCCCSCCLIFYSSKVSAELCDIFRTVCNGRPSDWNSFAWYRGWGTIVCLVLPLATFVIVIAFAVWYLSVAQLMNLVNILGFS